MDEKDFEALLESKAPQDADPRMAEALENAARFDAALREALQSNPAPVRLPDRIYPVRASGIFTPARLIAAAAVVALVVAAAFLLLSGEKLPVGDPSTLAKCIASATDTSLAPTELTRNQVALISYYGKNYGDYARMRSDGTMPDLNAAWLKACSNFEKKTIASNSGERSSGKRIAALEAAATECSGVVSKDFISAYRSEVDDSAKLVEAALADWRAGKQVIADWAQDAWPALSAILASDGDTGRDEAYRAWRALLEGAATDEMADALKKAPKNLQLPLAELASAITSRRLRYAPNFTGNPGLLCAAADKLKERLQANAPDALGRFGYLSEMPLYSAFYFYPGTVPALLRRTIDRADKILEASQKAMPGRRMDSVISPLLESFRANDRLLTSSLPGASSNRLCDISLTALADGSFIPRELSSLMVSVNRYRLLIGEDPICPVFSRPETTTILKLPLRLSYSDPAIYDPLKELLIGTCNRFAFGGSPSNEDSVTLYLFRAATNFEVPDIFRLKGSIDSYVPSFRTGDTPGRF